MKKRWIDDLSVLALLLLSVFSLVSLIADSFSCITRPALYLWLAGVCAILWGTANFKRGLILGLPLLAATLYAAFRLLREDPVAELADLTGRITAAFYEHVIMPGSVYPLTSTIGSHVLILLFIGTILAAFLAVALSARPYWTVLSLLATLPFFAGCIVVNGEPPILSCAGLVLFWILILIRGQGSNIDGAVGRTVLCATIPVALLLGAILVFQQPQRYEYTEQDIELSRLFDRTERIFEFFSGGRSSQHAALGSPDGAGDQGVRSSFRSSWDTEDDRMDLSQGYDFDHTDLRIFQVMAQTDGKLYLRTRSFGSYVGNGWLPAEELDQGSSLPFAAFAADQAPGAVKRELEIRSFADLGALCLPYWSAISSGSDSSVSDNGQTDYRVSYTEYKGSPALMRLPQEALGAERVYRAYAHDFYTQLPASTSTWATALCIDAGLDPGRDDILEAVAIYVGSQATYDLGTQPYDSADHALSFLTDMHRGYCIHYASAAAVLYRAIGIPARVTEGFMVEARAGRFVDVTAGNGHAWVEVYQDGVGWIPVEVTTTAGIATMDEPPSPTETPEPIEPSLSPSPDAQLLPAEPSTAPTDLPGADPSPTESPVEATPTASSEGSGLSPVSPDPATPARHFPWALLLVILALPAVAALWYGAARLHFLSSIRDRDGRRAAIACWRYAEKLGRYGAEMPDEIRRIAEKAAFSSHLILREETDVSRSALLTLIDQTYGQLSPMQKFVFRFLLGLR